MRKHSKYFSYLVNCFAKFDFNVKYVEPRAFSTFLILLNDKNKRFKLQVGNECNNFNQIKILLNKMHIFQKRNSFRRGSLEMPIIFILN